MKHQARPEDQEPLRARRQAARRRGRAAQEAEARTSASTGGLHQGGQRLQGRLDRHRHDLAGHREHRRDEDAPVEGGPPEGGLDRLVGHLDGRGQGEAPELRLQVDGLHHLARRPTPRSRSTSARRRPTSRPASRPATRPSATGYHAADAAYADKIHYWTTPIKQCLDGRTDVTCTDYADWTQAWHGDQGLSRWRSTTATRGAAYLPPAPPPATGGAARCAAALAAGGLPRVARRAAHHRRCGRRTRSPARSSRIWTLDNFRDAAHRAALPHGRCCAPRDRGAVTLIDLLLALPIAFFMAKVASPRAARLLVVAVLMPLWASYLVKAYAWRLLVIDRRGVCESAPSGSTPGFGVPAVGAHAGLPVAAVHDPADLRRARAAAGLASSRRPRTCGARPWRTFRSVVLPRVPAERGRRLDLHVLADAGRLHHASRSSAAAPRCWAT